LLRQRLALAEHTLTGELARRGVELVAGVARGVCSLDGATLALDWDGLMAHLRALTPDAARGIDRVEILVPLPQLEKINIVDTPGLN